RSTNYSMNDMNDYAETAASFYDNSGFDAGSGVQGNEESELLDESAGNSENLDGQITRKLIKTVELSVETKQFDAFLQSLEERVAACGGYVEQSNVRGTSYQNSNTTRSADLMVRVPISKVDEFVGTVSADCNVLRKSENVEDVTLRYTDLESRKKALLVEQERLLELLAKAESMDAVISIEERLSDIRYQLESYESQLRVLENQVQYSTVSLYVQEAEVFTPVVEDGFWSQVQKGFQSNLIAIGEALEHFAIWFLSSIPLILFWGVLIALLMLVCLFVLRKNEEYHKKHPKPERELRKIAQRPLDDRMLRTRIVQPTQPENEPKPQKEENKEDKSKIEPKESVSKEQNGKEKDNEKGNEKEIKS
ncbi:MAG: DUF4349 domain-containing protein, partial [bacterium]|nr:DUF4349 domain-containing protein [bacterium]